MKIAMVSEHASPLATLGGVDAGGQNVHVEALAHAMMRLGHSVTVYTRRDDAKLPRRVRMASGAIVEHLDAGPPIPISKDAIFRHVPALASELSRALRADPPDVIHSHFWMSALAALAAAKPLGIPVAHTFHALGVEKRRHQGDADTSPSERIAAEARIAREAGAIIATSTSEIFELLRMGASSSTLKIVPCGVDVERFAPNPNVATANDGALRVLTVSRLVPRKGIETVIEGIAGVDGATLRIVGGGSARDVLSDPEARRLLACARAAGVADRVTLVGRIERAGMPDVFNAADVVVCAPWYEPFGIVPLEAMACGVPVVVSAVGGLVDTVVDGVTGYHVAAREPKQVARALRALLDARKRRTFGRAGIDRVRTRYAWARVAAETLDAYRSLRTRSVANERLATGS